MNDYRLARALGWFSIGLGVAELVAPRKLTRALGVSPRNKLVRAYGLREIATGVGLLTQARKAPWLWARVAGDALDLGTLAAGARRSNRTKWIAVAMGSVAAVAGLDILAGSRMSRVPNLQEA